MGRITVRSTEKTEEWLRSTCATKTTGAEYWLEALPTLYARAMHDMRGMFSCAELKLILDTMNGTSLTAGIAGQHIVVSVSDAILLEDAGQKWGIDAGSLLTRLEGLSWFSRACLEVWATGFWVAGHWQAGEGMDAWIRQLAPKE